MSKYRRPTLLSTAFVEDNTDDKYYYYDPKTGASTISSTGILYSQRQHETHHRDTIAESNSKNSSKKGRRRQRRDDTDAALRHNFYFPSLVAKYWMVLIEPRNEQEMIDPDQSNLWKQLRSDREAVKLAGEQRRFDETKKKIAAQRTKIAQEIRNEKLLSAKQQQQCGSESDADFDDSEKVDIQNSFPDAGLAFVSFSKELFTNPLLSQNNQQKNAHQFSSSTSSTATFEEQERDSHLQATTTILSTTLIDESVSQKLLGSGKNNSSSAKKSSSLQSNHDDNNNFHQIPAYVALLRTLFPWSAQHDLLFENDNDENDKRKRSLRYELKQLLRQEYCLPAYYVQFIAGIFFLGFEAAVQQNQADHMISTGFLMSKNNNSNSNDNNNTEREEEEYVSPEEKRKEAVARSQTIDGLPVLSEAELQKIFLMFGPVHSSHDVDASSTVLLPSSTTQRIIKKLISLWSEERRRTICLPRFPHGAPLVWIGLRRVEGTTRAFIDPECELSKIKRRSAVNLCLFLVKNFEQYVLRDPVACFPVANLVNINFSSSPSSSHLCSTSQRIFPTIQLLPDTAKFMAKTICESYFDVARVMTCDTLNLGNDDDDHEEKNRSITRLETTTDVAEMLAHFVVGVKYNVVQVSMAIRNFTTAETLLLSAKQQTDTSGNKHENRDRPLEKDLVLDQDGFALPSTGNNNNIENDELQHNGNNRNDDDASSPQTVYRIYIPNKMGQKILHIALMLLPRQVSNKNNKNLLHLNIRDRGIASFFIEISKVSLLHNRAGAITCNPVKLNPKICILFKDSSVADVISYDECFFEKSSSLKDFTQQQEKNNVFGDANHDDESDDGNNNDDELCEKDDLEKFNTIFNVAKKLEEYKRTNPFFMMNSHDQNDGLTDNRNANHEKQDDDDDDVIITRTILEKEFPHLQATLRFIAKNHPIYPNLIGCGIKSVAISVARTTLSTIIAKVIRVCGTQVEFNLCDAFVSDRFTGLPRLFCRQSDKKKSMLKFIVSVAPFHFQPSVVFQDYDPKDEKSLERMRDRMIQSTQAGSFPISLVEGDTIQTSLKHIIRCHPQFFSENVAGCGIRNISSCSESETQPDRDDEDGESNKNCYFNLERVCGRIQKVNMSECYIEKAEQKKLLQKQARDQYHQQHSDEDVDGDERSGGGGGGGGGEDIFSRLHHHPQSNQQQKEDDDAGAANNNNNNNVMILRAPMIPSGSDAVMFLKRSATGISSSSAAAKNSNRKRFIDFVDSPPGDSSSSKNHVRSENLPKRRDRQ